MFCSVRIDPLEASHSADAAVAPAQLNEGAGQMSMPPQGPAAGAAFSRSAMKDMDSNIHRGRSAMNKAILDKADVKRAMYRNDIGWVDFVWGDAGQVQADGRTKGAMGLAHILEARQRKDNMSHDDVVRMLTQDIVETIGRGGVHRHTVSPNGKSERLQIRHNGHEATMVKNAGNNAWLLTGYELYQSGADGVGFDTSAATHNEPTPARSVMGASDTDNTLPQQGLDVNQTRAAVAQAVGADQMRHIDVVSRDDVARPDNAENLTNAQGWYDSKTGQITLIAEALPDARTAQFVAWHELGHRKMDVSGWAQWRSLFDLAYQNNTVVKQAADNTLKQRAQSQDRAGRNRLAAVEEAIADLYAAHQTGDYAAFEARNGVKVPLAMRTGLGGYLGRLANQLRRVLTKVMGVDHSSISDADMYGWLKKLDKAEGAVSGSLNEGEKYSRNETKDAEFSRKAAVLQGEPVYTITERQAPKEIKALRDWATDLFEKAGGMAVNPEIGEVVLNARSVKDSMAHGMNADKAMAFEAVPSVLEQGVVVADTKYEGMTSYYISAPVDIEGRADIVTALVRKDMNTSRFYLHSVTTIENLLNAAPIESAADAEAPKPRGKLHSRDVASILRSYLNYKGNDTKFSRQPKDYNQKSAYEAAKTAGETELTVRQWQQVRTPEFKRWFGDWENDPDSASTVINPKTGEPLVMYHGTSRSDGGDAFTRFDTYGSNYGLMGQGSYFTDNAGVASSYTGKGHGDSPAVYSVFLNIRNPIDMDAQADAQAWEDAYPDASDYHDGGSSNEAWLRAMEESLQEDGVYAAEGAEIATGALSAMGFDGVTHVGGGRMVSDGVKHRVYVAYEPNQIKSATGNSGVFDASNDDIRYSRSEPLSKAEGAVSGSLNEGDRKYSRSGDFIAQAKQKVADLVRRVRADKGLREQVDLMPVADVAVAEAAEHGLDIAGYTHMLDSSAVNHVLNNHGNAASEAARGQIGITDSDFTAIINALENPDRVIYGSQNNARKEQIAYVSKLNDGSLLVLQEQRVGKHKLALMSMRKYPATVDDGSIIRTLLPNARSDGGNGLSIVDNPKSRNIQDKTNEDLAQGVDASNDDIRYSRSEPLSKAERRWTNEMGELQAGVAAYNKLTDLIKPALVKLRLADSHPQAFTQYMRDYRAQLNVAGRTAQEMVDAGVRLTAAERQLLSDVLEKELPPGAEVAPELQELAGAMREVLSQQSDDLVALDMLSEASRERFKDTYLPRMYQKHMSGDMALDKLNKELGRAMRGMLGNAVKGSHLKGRGIFKEVKRSQQAEYEADGWEMRHDYGSKGKKANTVVMWRDYSREERASMGEVRDAMLRFTSGYIKTQSDIAKGMLFKRIAADGEMASDTPVEGWEQVPDTVIAATGGVKRYGALAGMYVHPEVKYHLQQQFFIDNAAQKIWRRSLGCQSTDRLVKQGV